MSQDIFFLLVVIAYMLTKPAAERKELFWLVVGFFAIEHGGKYIFGACVGVLALVRRYIGYIVVVAVLGLEVWCDIKNKTVWSKRADPRF